MKFKTMLAMALGALAADFAAAGDLAVSAYWQDHMVLQRGKRITVWGKDAAGRSVTVSFAGQTANATTGSDGFWETTFAQPFALSATPQALTIADSANESITLSDVLVGDVYLAAGQSNMDRRLEDKNKANFEEPQAIKDFCRDDDGIRFLRIARSAENATSGEQLFDLPPIKAVNDAVKYYGEGHDWSPATGDDRNFVSSVALNFAHYIRRTNAEKGENIPIGIIHASSGGTAIREWIAPSVLIANGIPSNGYTGSSDGWFWNNMMAPILRAKFRAVLWYQGCSDAQRQAEEYEQLMNVLVKDRRERWGENGDLPFYAVQIATPGYSASAGTVGLDAYPAPTESDVGHNYVRVREAQRLWDVSDAGTHGLVTTVDCVPCMGVNDLHPVDKNFIGRRLSLFARRDIYGEPSLQADGPVYTRSVREADGSVRIFFKSGTAKGLTAGRVKPASSVALSHWVKKSADSIRGFAICGSDNVWKDAVATVEGETIVLRADGVATPTQFHYGYWCITRETDLENGQRLNLYNEAGLPMSPVAPQTVEDASSSAKVADPVLLPASCYFSPSTNVTIACATSGATIRYTLDGTEPTATSTAYTAPITLSATTTIKARAFAANKDPSDIVFATYTLGEPPAPEPDPQWTNGAYEPSAWAPLGENLLAGATASYSGNLSYIGSKDMAKLTDGRIPVDISGDTGAGSQTEVVGFQEDAAAVWTFAEPTTIGKIRISTRWATTSFDAITVKDVYVLQGDDWVALGVPDSHKSGIASITTGSLEATLEDEELGYLAQNVSGLKIVFGAPESAVANYYAEIEAIAPGGEIPDYPPPDYPPPDDPPDDPPSGESVRTWTTGDYDPSAWTGLENNILAGLTAVATDMSKISFAASKDLSKLTDGAVSATAASTEIVGLCPDAELVWNFSEPKVLEKIRFSSLWSSRIYAGISVKDILVQTSGSSEWVSLGVSITKSGNDSAAGAQYATLSDPGLGYLALDVVALKFVSGSVEAFANYYAEIEAVGRTSSAAYPPALSGLKVKPWGTSAEFSGLIASVGTGASSCDVYLAYGSDANHLGAPVKIYSGNAGAFHYELEGLSQNTNYSYLLSVSNNAATVMGCEASGTFTTTDEVHPDWSGYKWAVIGDSLTDPTLAPGIGNYYYNFVAGDTGIQLVYTNGVGSTGYKNKYNVDGGKCFYQRLLANPLPSDVDVVTIFGSVNDWRQVRNAADAGDPTDTLADGKETLAAYMNKAIDVVQAQAPNAKLVLVGSLYYYNVVTEAHVRANETLRIVAAQRGIAFYDWLTEDTNDPLDFHHIADNPTAEGSFAQRYTRDCPSVIVPGETSFGHPSAEYHEAWLSPHFRGVLAATLSGAPAPLPTVATPTFSPTACSFYPTTNVTLSCATSGATIRYTLDGSDPTAESVEYTAPIALSATTTIKARAYKAEMNASAVVSATYTFTEPSLPPDDPTVVTNGMWATSEFAPSAWSPLANNLLANMTGTTSGYISGYGGGAGLLTDGVISGDTKQTCGFGENATVAWTFDGSKTLEKIRFTTCYTANWGIYDDIKISKVEVKTTGSDSWTDLCVEPIDYAGSGTAGTALSATIENAEAGFLGQNVTALRITFATPNNVAQYYAEIEAVGTASGGEPVATVATPAFSPADCSFYPTTNITLTCTTSGATIRYTLDGSDPTAESAEYTAPIELSATTTVKARAFADWMNPSAVVSAIYTMTDSSTPSPEWTTNVVAPSVWSPLADNLLDGRTGAISGATAGDTYASRNPGLLTDGSVPMAGGVAYIVGFQNGASISWTFENPVTLGQVRISCGYLAQTGYSGFTVSAVEVQKSESSVWTAVSAAAGQMKDTGKADILTLTLADGNGLALAENVTALRVSFATPPIGFANYCAEIEAAGTEAGGDVKVYPEWIDATSEIATAKYDAWATKFNVGDPTAAQKDAYLLNCANTTDAVAAAKAAFKVVSIAVNADGTVDVGLPAAPVDGFNGTVSILGCETVDGEYHAMTTGNLLDALYRVPATSNDHFFKASLDM